ncbi:hypothetical protein MUY14_28310 [Amycolatopsis sp. FBCC-B4732]|uniref:hypothetical protein n=1 Tax=Amycolatopsis sp. FBCC-B4732 TaxID=3079339 RepID=UPI001FF1882D|nr:hypothetical protein [Amycolatopsis sp. FBCC-B4732]UOX85677.1 hypothetical protein MUY14_28310 [Amycolatopsis sp. FBCC-B4732]
MTDHELATKLKELADVPAPPLRLDIDGARREGGRRRRLRTTALVVGCAAVVTAGGLTAVSVFRPQPAPAPPAVQPQPVAPAPTDNPLVAKASFGWLPEEVTGVEYAAGGHGDTALAIGRGELPPMLWLTVSDREPAPPRDLSGEPKKVPQRVGDRDGHWVTADATDPLNHGDSYLRWPTADGRWAQLHTYYLARPDLQQALLRVAEGATFANRGVPLPLRITSLPPSFHLSDAYTSRRPDQDGVPWKLVLQYSANGALVTINVAPPGSTGKDGLGVPRCVQKNGLEACVGIDKEKAAGVTAQELLSRITLLGPDEKAWTPHVLG